MATLTVHFKDAPEGERRTITAPQLSELRILEAIKGECTTRQEIFSALGGRPCVFRVHYFLMRLNDRGLITPGIKWVNGAKRVVYARTFDTMSLA